MIKANRQELQQRVEHEQESLLQEQEVEIEDELAPAQETITAEEANLETLAETMETRNTIDISELAKAALRCGTSSRSTALLATAYLGDLIKAGVLPLDAANLAVDINKVQRAKEKVMGSADKLEKETPQCLMFDSRVDKKTLVMVEDEETKKNLPSRSP